MTATVASKGKSEEEKKLSTAVEESKKKQIDESTVGVAKGKEEKKLTMSIGKLEEKKETGVTDKQEAEATVQ